MTEKQLIEKLTKARQTMEHLINTGANPQIRAAQERLINNLKAKLANL